MSRDGWVHSPAGRVAHRLRWGPLDGIGISCSFVLVYSGVYNRYRRHTKQKAPAFTGAFRKLNGGETGIRHRGFRVSC